VTAMDTETRKVVERCAYQCAVYGGSAGGGCPDASKDYCTEKVCTRADLEFALEEAERRADRLHLAYIEASNPGIDMERVKAELAARASSGVASDRLRVVIEAEPCPRMGRIGWMKRDTPCPDCHGTGYVIPSSVRSDRPAQPGDTIELAVEGVTLHACEGNPELRGIPRVVAVADVTDCRRVKVNERGRLRRVDVLTLANPRPPSHKENP
jgi:hypothetical protein